MPRFGCSLDLSAVKTKPASKKNKKKKQVFPEKSLLEIFYGED